MLQVPTIHPTDELLTPAAAAKLLGVHRTTLVMRAIEGRVPARKVGTILYFRRADIEAMRDFFADKGTGRRPRRPVPELKGGAALERKTSRSTLKAATGSLVDAVCWTCSPDPDHDGEIAGPGAFREGQHVVLSGWAHSSFKDRLPVGRGTIHRDGDKIRLRGEFFDTHDGREAREVIKQLRDIVELSIGFYVKRSRQPTREESARGVKRVLLELDVREVSFVLVGAAGTGRTGVRDIKGDTPVPSNAAALREFARYVQTSTRLARKRLTNN